MSKLTTEQIKRQKALAWLKRVAYENPCMKEVKTCIEVLSAPAQPVIPERPELRYGDNVLWFLNELAAFDASDIDSDDFDVYGEGRNGMEGCATISITELAADAAKLLSAQPVIPEQPKTELVDLSQQVEILNRILNWILKELPVPTQKATVMAIRLSSVIGIISDLEVSAQKQK